MVSAFATRLLPATQETSDRKKHEFAKSGTESKVLVCTPLASCVAQNYDSGLNLVESDQKSRVGGGWRKNWGVFFTRGFF